MMIRITPGVLNILILQGLAFLFTALRPDYADALLLYKLDFLHIYEENFGVTAYHDQFQPYQIVTYFFASNSVLNLFFMSLAMIFVGSAVEMVMGTPNFVKYYFTISLASGLLIAFFDPDITPLAGASIPLTGMMTAFTFYYPEEKLVVFPIFIPVRAKILFMIYVGITVLLFWINPFAGGFDNIAALIVSATLFIPLALKKK